MDLHVLGMARSGTTVIRNMLLNLLRTNSVDCLNMGEFFSLLKTYGYGEQQPILLMDEEISLHEQGLRDAEMMQRYHEKQLLYSRYNGRMRLAKHVFGYRYDLVLDALSKETRFVCIIREDSLDHILSWCVAARSGLYNTASGKELADTRAAMKPFRADLATVRQWVRQHDLWMACYQKLLSMGIVVATIRYEQLESDMSAAIPSICSVLGITDMSHRLDAAHDVDVLKLWSKEDKIRLVENHEDIRQILEGADDGLAL